MTHQLFRTIESIVVVNPKKVHIVFMVNHGGNTGKNLLKH